MNDVLKLTSPIPVSVNHYMKARGFVTWKGNTPIANVTMYETADAKAYKKAFKKYVEKQVRLQEYSLIPNKSQHFYIDCVFYFERVDQDPNNYFKLPLDAITETQLIWLDDNVTCERVNAIFYDSNNPRIEMTIKPVKYKGIFPDIDHLNEFENKCKECNRYKRNCSILKKAIEGRIQQEIKCEECSKFTKNKQS